MQRDMQHRIKGSKEKSYLRKISDATILGGISAVLVAGLLGCDGSAQTTNAQEVAQKRGMTVTLQEQHDGSYQIISETPSPDGDTTIIVRDIDGNKRILSKEEVDEIVAEEAKRIDNNTSTLTSGDGGGLGLGGAILASAAGALIGSYIGNKLFNNSNYKAQAQRNSPSAYQRSATSASSPSTARTASSNQGTMQKATTTPSNAKSGFFGSNKQNATSAAS